MARRKNTVGAASGWSGTAPIDREAVSRAMNGAGLDFPSSARHSLITALSLYQLNRASTRQGRDAKDVSGQLETIIKGLKRVEQPTAMLDRAPGLAMLLGDRDAAEQLKGLWKVRETAERALAELKAKAAPADHLNVLLGQIRDLWTDAGGDSKAYLFPESNSARTPPLVAFAMGILGALPDEDRPEISAKAIAERLLRIGYSQTTE